MRLLMKPLAIPLMKLLAIPLGGQKTLHSHLTKSANYAN